MGFFSEIANEARRGVAGSQAQTAVRQESGTPPSHVAPEPAPVPAVSTAPEPAQPTPTPTPELKLDTAQDAAPAPDDTEAR